MAKYTNDDIKSLTDAYIAGQDVMSKIEVDIPAENNVDPLLLIRTINGPKTIDSILPLVIALVKGQNVSFRVGDKVIFTASIRSDVMPETFSNIFIGQPQLMELLVNVGYGIMLKKLTPPSSVLTNVGNTPGNGADKQIPETGPGF